MHRIAMISTLVFACVCWVATIHVFVLWCSVRFSFLSNCESSDEVILDGIDEASDVKGVLQSYIMRRLVPMEISLVLTSRPEGVSADLNTLKQKFAIMTLKPLSDEQQKQIILNQVKSEGNQFFEKLMKFAETRQIWFTVPFWILLIVVSNFLRICQYLEFVRDLLKSVSVPL